MIFFMWAGLYITWYVKSLLLICSSFLLVQKLESIQYLMVLNSHYIHNIEAKIEMYALKLITKSYMYKYSEILGSILEYNF